MAKKFFVTFDNVFHVLMSGLKKYAKIFIHFIGFEMHMDRLDKSENILGFDLCHLGCVIIDFQIKRPQN